MTSIPRTARALTRRALLRGALWAAGASAGSAAGCTRDPSAADAAAPARTGWVPDGDLLDPGMDLGHRLRDAGASFARAAPAAAADAPVLDVVIVGGGVAGLAAARALRAAGMERFELLEMSDLLGGTARAGRSAVTAFPWGAHYVTTPLADDALTTQVLEEVGALEGRDALGHPVAAERFAVREPEERLWVEGPPRFAARASGHFFDGLAPEELFDDVDRRDFARFEALLDGYAALVDAAGRPAFALPRARSSTDAALLALDRLSFRDWLLEQGLVSPHLHWLCDYAVRDDDGVALDQASAWAGLFYFCARRRPGVAERSVITRADGNGFLVDHLARACAGRRAVGEAVVDVRAPAPARDLAAVDARARAHAEVVTLDAAGALRTRRARRVIVAAPRFVAARIVAPLRERPPPWLARFTTSAWVVCNVHLSERPAPAGGGVPFAWDTVFARSESLGFVEATHQSGRDHGPTVWTWYRPLVDDDGARGRSELLAGDRAHWARACLADLSRAFPDVRELATRVDVCRWGHAMVRPVPGLFSSGALEAAAAPVALVDGGPAVVHFAHTDLSGMALFEEALHHGDRAAREVLAALTASGAARDGTGSGP